MGHGCQEGMDSDPVRCENPVRAGNLVPNTVVTPHIAYHTRKAITRSLNATAPLDAAAGRTASR